MHKDDYSKEFCVDHCHNTRKVKVAISQMGSKDYDNDVIDHGAYNKTMAERGPKGANLIWHLTDHNPSLKSAIGKFSELYVEGDYLVGITDVPNTTWGNDVLEFYKSGHINQHSVGFRTIKAEAQQKGQAEEYNLIKEILLFEGGGVSTLPFFYLVTYVSVDYLWVNYLCLHKKHYQ